MINCIFSTGNYSSKLFSKELNLLLKKKRHLSILLTALKFALMILIKKTLVKKILMKKTKYRTWTLQKQKIAEYEKLLCNANFKQ